MTSRSEVHEELAKLIKHFAECRDEVPGDYYRYEAQKLCKNLGIKFCDNKGK